MGTLTGGWLIVATALLGATIYVLIYHLKRLRLYRQALVFSGPQTLPFVGNALHFLGNTEDILHKFGEFSNSYSSPFRVWLGPELLIFVSEPEQIKTVLCSDRTIEKSDLYRFFRPWLGNGLFSAPAAHWRVHRKLIGPSFNTKILESFVSVFAAQSKDLVKRLETKLNGAEFRISDSISLCTLSIICETAMGITTSDQQSKSGTKYVEASHKVLAIAYKRIFKVWLHPDEIFNRTQLGKEHNECIKTLHGFTDDVIQRKRQALLSRNREKSTIGQEDDTYSPGFRKKAYLDLLMELSYDEMKLSDSEVREEVDTMIVAGNDTASTVLNFVMLMLALHPDIQDKVYEELCDIYGSSEIDDCTVTPEDVSRMELMERVIKETMRIFPVAPVISRSLLEDFDIDGFTLPKGCSIFVAIMAVHRNEKYWKDPLKFDPDRFLPEEITKRHSYCYLPFSGGPRNCIGVKFAMMEMKTIVATVLSRYVLKKDNVIPISDIKLKSETLLKPVDPITLRIERRSSKIN